MTHLPECIRHRSGHHLASAHCHRMSAVNSDYLSIKLTDSERKDLSVLKQKVQI